MALVIRYTDPSTEGSNLFAYVFRMSDGYVWDADVGNFIAPSVRTEGMQIALTENTAFHGMHEASVTDISDSADVMIRIEDEADMGTALGVLYRTQDSSSSSSGIDLDVEIPGTDIGDGNFTFGELLEALLAAAIGRIRVDRTKRWIRFYHLNGSALRTLNLVQNAAESERNPPGTGGADPGD